MTKLKLLEQNWAAKARVLSQVRAVLRQAEHDHSIAMKDCTEAKNAYIDEFERTEGLEDHAFPS